MARKKEGTAAQQEEAASPLLQAIDPRQAAANNLTSTPDDTADVRDQPQPDPKDNPAAPNDVSNTADPNDPMTLTGHDAQPGENGQ